MRVLYIDNDPEDLEFFIEAMKAVNPSVICLTALGGQEALNLLSSSSTSHELPDYIFLDINMSPMNGKTTLKEIKKMEKCESVKIVILSTTWNPKYVDEYLKLGAGYFLEKANSFQNLCVLLRTFFEA